MKQDKPQVVRTHDVQLDADYVQWLGEIKARYRSAQAKAAVRVNAEQLLFNWLLGRDLVQKKADERWGSGVVEQVSLDLQAAFPESKGFSAPNLWFMKKWYLFYTSLEGQEKLYQLGRELQDADKLVDTKLYQLGREINTATPQQPDGDFQKGVPFPMYFALVPWRHHVEIVTKSKTEAQNPTIGLLICSNKDETEVQYAFRGVQTPMGVASYNNVQIREIQEKLPSVEELKKRIRFLEEELAAKK